MSDRRDPLDGDPPWEMLARFVAGESDADEAARVQAWLVADPSRARMLDHLTAALGRLDAAIPTDLDVEAGLRRVHQRIVAEQDVVGAAVGGARMGLDAENDGGVHTDVLPLTHARRRRGERAGGWSSTQILRAAAAVLLVFAAVYVWRAVQAGPGDGGAVIAQTYRTGVGQLDTLRLPDGALVVLAPASWLTVPAGYGGAERIVELTGVALFDVVHDETRPFTVIAGGRTVRDMGTTFTVRTGDDGVEVAVTSGTVQVEGSNARDVVDLRAGDRAEIRFDGRAAIERGVVTDRDVEWTRGRVTFDDATVDRVATELRRWYGIELTWSDPATARRRVTATFEGEEIAQVLAVLAAVLDTRIERDGDTARIQSRHGPESPPMPR